MYFENSAKDKILVLNDIDGHAGDWYGELEKHVQDEAEMALLHGERCEERSALIQRIYTEQPLCLAELAVLEPFVPFYVSLEAMEGVETGWLTAAENSVDIKSVDFSKRHWVVEHFLTRGDILEHFYMVPTSDHKVNAMKQIAQGTGAKAVILIDDNEHTCKAVNELECPYVKAYHACGLNLPSILRAISNDLAG